MKFKLLCVLFVILCMFHQMIVAQEGSGGSGSGDGAEGSGDETVAETSDEGGSGEKENTEEGSGDDESEDEECEEVNDGSGGSGSGDDIGDILALDGKKKVCKKSKSGDDGSGENEGSGEDEELSGADALAAELDTCDMEGMDEKLSSCLSDYGSRLKTLEQTVLSGEGGVLEEQIELVLVKNGVIDCKNDTQCADDRKCMDSIKERGRMLCESPCDREHCYIQHSECVVEDHIFSCECKEGFHGNGSVSCVPDGFTSEENGKHYKMFDDAYVEFDNATEKCNELGARLPVLDTAETITIIKKYLDTSNFTVFEQWDRSSRRVWLGLIYQRGSGLVWADGARIVRYPASSRLFVWEARRLLSQEASYADNTRHYGFYIDGDIAKLPGGGRKGAAILCELIPPVEGQPQYAQPPPSSYGRGGYPSSYPTDYSDGGYPNYPNERRRT